IAIIGILAAVLIPNLLNARERAYDTAAQTCLRQIATEAEVAATLPPSFDYTNAPEYEAATNLTGGCVDVTVSGGPNEDGDGFEYTARRAPSPRTWVITQG